MHLPYKSNFREEMITVAAFMAVVITGSFYMIYRSNLQPPDPEISLAEEAAVLGALDDTIKNGLDLSKKNTPLPAPTPTPKPSTPAVPVGTNSASPVYDPEIFEQPYGEGGEYNYPDYHITFLNPRLTVSDSRLFKVDVILANKKVDEGLANRVSATIVKEGVIIAQSVPFSLSESATVYPGEQITFSATLSLISGTDISRVNLFPQIDGIPEANHEL